MRPLLRLVAFTLTAALVLTGCSSVAFSERFGQPASDADLSDLQGAWQINGEGALLVSYRGEGWFEIAGINEDRKIVRQPVDAEKTPEPSFKIEQTHFAQLREFQDHTYLWLNNPEAEETPEYMPFKVAGPADTDLDETPYLVLWMPNVEHFNEAVKAGRLAGTPGDDDAPNVKVHATKQALQAYFQATPEHAWLHLDKPLVLERITQND